VTDNLMVYSFLSH